MPNFRYQVIDAAGKKSEGIVEAASIGEATRKRKTDGKYISSLTLDRGTGLANMTIGSPMLKTKDLVLISRQPQNSFIQFLCTDQWIVDS